jgi:hypothetical protein
MRILFIAEVSSGEGLMTEGKEEIIVKAPPRPATAPEKKVEKATERALEEERYGVLSIPEKIGKYFGAFSVGAGVLMVVFLAYAFFSGQPNLLFLSLASSFPILDLWIFVGLISIIVGFLLLGIK